MKEPKNVEFNAAPGRRSQWRWSEAVLPARLPAASVRRNSGSQAASGAAPAVATATPTDTVLALRNNRSQQIAVTIDWSQYVIPTQHQKAGPSENGTAQKGRLVKGRNAPKVLGSVPKTASTGVDMFLTGKCMVAGAQNHNPNQSQNQNQNQGQHQTQAVSRSATVLQQNDESLAVTLESSSVIAKSDGKSTVVQSSRSAKSEKGAKPDPALAVTLNGKMTAAEWSVSNHQKHVAESIRQASVSRSRLIKFELPSVFRD